MPTGYTNIINENPDTTFEQFAWRCARNFGALITMRDDKFDTPVPEAFTVSDFYFEHVTDSEREVDRLQALTPEAAQAEALAEYEAEILRRAERDDLRRLQKARYERMLARVKAWSPPSPEHEGMKNFMVSQLKESIEWDCAPIDYTRERYVLPSQNGETWRMEKIRDAEEDLARRRESLEEEAARVAGRNQWMKQLRESLTSESVPA